MKLLPDSRLYVDSDYCRRWLCGMLTHRHIDAEAHTVVGRYSMAGIMGLRTFARTQPYKLNVWADSATELVTAWGDVAQFGTLHYYDARREAEGTPLAGHNVLDATAHDWRSDVFRLIILYKYGGIYFDLDTIWLRPLPLLFGEIGDVEFCYCWGIEPYGNNAVVRLNAGGPNATALITEAARTGLPIPQHRLRIDNGLDLLCLPPGVFDPYWYLDQPFDVSETFNCTDPQRIAEIRGKMAGSFCHHWHGRWDEEMKFGCLAEVLAQ